jgi:mRNA (guanine-N7-)-methyltransferase
MEEVKGFYNRKKKQTQKERANSPLIALRKYNNYVKSSLIASALESALLGTNGEGARVLDLCGGFGGDLSKYAHHNVKQVVLVDISEDSVNEARRRYEEGNFTYEAQFFCCNAFNFKTMSQLLFPQYFDVISCQFALHYAFASAQQVNEVFHLISWALKPTGKFIATVPNAEVIRPKLQEANSWCFGHARVERGGMPHEYLFTLDTAVERVPEYYVDLNIVDEVARKWGLQRKGHDCPFKTPGRERGAEPPFKTPTTDGGDCDEEVLRTGHPLAQAPPGEVFVSKNPHEITLDEKSSFVKTFYISFVLSKIKQVQE